MSPECVLSRKVFSIIDCDSFHSHYVNAKIKKEVSPAVEEIIKRSSDPTFVWSTFPTDAIEYMVRALQAFSDKLQMNFRSVSVKFYTQHHTFPHIINEI